MLQCVVASTSGMDPSSGCFQKFWYPQIIHFNRLFHEINHPFWGVFPLFLETSLYHYPICNPRHNDPMSTGARPHSDTHIGQMTTVLTKHFSENRRIVGEVLGLINKRYSTSVDFFQIIFKYHHQNALWMVIVLQCHNSTQVHHYC